MTTTTTTQPTLAEIAKVIDGIGDLLERILAVAEPYEMAHHAAAAECDDSDDSMEALFAGNGIGVYFEAMARLGNLAALPEDRARQAR